MQIAITGVGCVSPIGTSAPGLAEALSSGALGVRAAPWSAPGDPSLFAAVHDGFDATKVADERLRDGTDRVVHFGLAASAEALDQAGLGSPDALDPFRTAVVDGTSMGGFYSLMHAQWALDTGGPAAIPPKSMLKVWSNMTAAQVAIRHGLHGPQLTVTTACASGLDALGQAAGLISAGVVDVALCGGTEGGALISADHPGGFRPVTSVAGRMLGMESGEEDPARAVLPFDVDRSGIVFGEGAAWFVLESARHVAQRGRDPLAWLVGYGSCADAHHPSSPDPSGRFEARAMELALAGAGRSASDVDVVFAHATGTPKGDLAEIRALNSVFGSVGGRSRAQVTALKGHTGHTGASAGAMSVTAAIDLLQTGRLPAVRGTRAVDPEVGFDLVVGEHRTTSGSTVQVNAFGFGGQDASVLLSVDPR